MTALRLTLGLPLTITLLIILLIGVVTWPLALDGAWEWYDTARPVATGKVHGIARGADGNLQVDITVSKHRNCDRQGVYGYVYLPDSAVRRVKLNRAGFPAVGHLRAGESLRATWRVQESADAIGAGVRVEYDCSGRTVISDVAEITPRELRELLK